EGHIQHAGVAFNASGDPFHIYRNAPADFSGVNRFRQFPAVTGACFSVPRTRYQAFHGLREDYLNGYEDVDFCLRARAAGLDIWYQPKSVVYHLESQTPGRKKFEAENRTIFFGRWRGHIAPDAQRYYREDGLPPPLFPFVEWMTHAVEPSNFSPSRWRVTPRTPAWVRTWLPPAEEIVAETAFEGAIGEVRRGCQHLNHLVAVAPVGIPGGPDVAGTLQLAVDGSAVGHDRLSGRQVTFPAELTPTMTRQLFYTNLRVNHPRWLLKTGLRGLARGAVDGEVYAQEFATLWARSAECLQFRTEHLLQQGRVDVALAGLQAFYQEDRHNTYATLQLADVLTRQGETRQARDILDAFLRIKPAHLRARWLRLKV
ncbi:MAG TPA: tetratricopeptide repeat protein, partial [Candidatus Xenobia bacterium]